ncbi:MAG: hypothetical protein COT81_04350 [Candidatus Buchananbacteria bacterium CG10_big_fil_rev_8_21_14_0_10_42_9]|uniref:Glycosyltransferase RgtA/B/C/D-like domain-containing protein n=1 Tax=Candidatus Buchananbacteria bacterium CG10_big_fil_rev_8_21_14_0_10_42_9 TaxID=1974526 RepID=A0A2H0W2K6_9BACT|nr:MAG: hypothetical protein COT81_04350 [Candidatus Buchananbacteria bacterium CG10_big_fil_rev_8_21_14_0_10_42_9]
MLKKIWSEHKIFIFIFLMALVLRFWGISTTAVASDAALYAFRALGWVDYLGGGQSSPIIWFGQIPWWGNLSFHDQPPLVFALMHLSMRLFGQSSLAVLLPSLLAGLGATIIIHLILLRFRNKTEALMGAGFFSLSSYAVWTARTGYLESVELFFIILSIYWFLVYWQTKQRGYLYGWAAATGFALMSKYTALFLLPAVFVFILLYKPALFIKKRMLLAAGIIIAVLSPVIVYNVMVFKTRGHFDAALSSIVGMSPDDYAVLSSRGSGFDILGNLYAFGNTLSGMMSLPLLLAFVASAVVIIWQATDRKVSFFKRFLALNLLFLIVMFFFNQASPRFLPIVLPFFTISLAVIANQVWRIVRRSMLAAVVLVAFLLSSLTLEFAYAINTNLVKNPAGQLGTHYATDRFFDTGFYDLDEYLRHQIYEPLASPSRPTTLEDLLGVDSTSRDIILIDERANWFARTWYFTRYMVYYDVPILDFTSLSQLTQGQRISVEDFFNATRAKSLWFVYAVPDGLPTNQNNFTAADTLAQNIESAATVPATEIKNYKGEVVFKVFKLK